MLPGCQMLQNRIYFGDLTIAQCLALSFSGSETEKIGFVSTPRYDQFIGPSVMLTKFEREGRVNQNAILLIYIDKRNQPRDQIHSLFGAHSLPVVKSRWKVKLSSEDSRASWNQSKQRQLLACLTAMLNEGDASFPTEGQHLEGSMLSNSAAKPLLKHTSGCT